MLIQDARGWFADPQGWMPVRWLPGELPGDSLTASVQCIPPLIFCAVAHSVAPGTIGCRLRLSVRNQSTA
jgi:hypothetical protein